MVEYHFHSEMIIFWNAPHLYGFLKKVCQTQKKGNKSIFYPRNLLSSVLLCNAKAKKRKQKPNDNKITTSNSIPKVPKALVSPSPTLTMSMKYVNGEIKAIGDIVTGMNKGLMNIKGNLIRTVKTIVFPGVSVEGTERIRLKLANAKPATIIPRITMMRFIES